MDASSFIVRDFFLKNFRTATKILSFRELKRGWHYGEGHPVSRVISDALEFLLLFETNKISDTDAFASVGGEIQVVGCVEAHTIELTVEKDRTFTVAHDLNEQEVSYEHSLSRWDAMARIGLIIEKVQQYQCATSGSSIQVTSFTLATALQVQHLELPVGVARPFSARNAQLRSAARSVSTPIDTMRVSAVTLQSYGSSTTQSFPRVAA